jgi:Rrf2 family protein
VISQTAEYALRAMVCLGTMRQGPRTAQDISEESKVPVSYLSKILRSLARSGLVGSQRGPKGGFFLARAPREISILDVVGAVDPWKRIERCPLGNPDHDGALCSLHTELAKAQSLIEETFRRLSLADLIEGASNAGGRCGFPGRTPDDAAK